MTSPLPVYNCNEPAHLQETDWDCSCESTEWALFSWGRTPDDNWIENSMIAAGVANPAVGLTDASGALLANWLNVEYGEFGYVASSTDPISFDALAREAATLSHPIMAGGRGWGHWTGVRGYDATRDVLLLANPAPNWMGIDQLMSRDQFSQLGSFSMVRLTHPAAENQPLPPRPTPPALLRGIDVSSHQGQVDWRAVAASGVAFAFTKATGGTWYKNPTFPENWAGMREAGLQSGCYHYAFESSGQPFPGAGPEAEAQYFVDAIMAAGGLRTGDLLALDLEDGEGPLGNWCLLFLERVEALTGVRPMMYTGAWFADPHGLGQTPALSAYPLWQAAYQVTPPAPCAPWSAITIWQHSAEGRVPGVVGPVDLNRFAGTCEELLGYGLPGTTPSPDNPYIVGQGIRDAMTAAGDVPATDEVFFNSQYGDAWSEALSTAGARYIWLPRVGRAFRYGPSG